QDVRSLRVERKGAGPYTLERQEGGSWKITRPFDAAALDRLVTPMVEVLSRPHCERYEALAASDLKKYGLDRPELRLRVTTREAGAPARELLVGGKAEGGPDRYGKLGDGPAVFVLRGDVVRELDHPAVDLVDTLLLSV